VLLHEAPTRFFGKPTMQDTFTLVISALLTVTDSPYALAALVAVFTINGVLRIGMVLAKRL